MAKKKKVEKEKIPQENQQAEKVTSVSTVDPPSVTLFDEASLKLQKERHAGIGRLFDSATEVLGNYLDDPGIEVSAKMFPAKLAADLFLAQEKFRREDKRIEIEERKLRIEEAKLSQQKPFVQFNQQNNFNGQAVSTDFAELKKKQEEILASLISPPPEG